MVKLRLMRMGKKKQPTYRVVAADSRKARNGRFIEIVGTYQPRLDPSVIKIDNAKAVKWLRQGAQPTERVEKLLRVSGAWDEFKGLAPGTSGTYQAPAGQVDDAEESETPVAAAPAPAAGVTSEAPADAKPADETTSADQTTEGGE